MDTHIDNRKQVEDEIHRLINERKKNEMIKENRLEQLIKDNIELNNQIKILKDQLQSLLNNQIRLDSKLGDLKHDMIIQLNTQTKHLSDELQFKIKEVSDTSKIQYQCLNCKIKKVNEKLNNK